ncbi:MAG: type II toxin-antitoxin system RelE family toxin [Beijerinckiaceae bacterium]
MKTVRYTADALRDLRKLRGEAKAIMAKIDRYAETGAGDVKRLVGQDGAMRIRIGDVRAIFEQTAAEIVVTKVGDRKNVYE